MNDSYAKPRMIALIAVIFGLLATLLGTLAGILQLPLLGPVAPFIAVPGLIATIMAGFAWGALMMHGALERESLTNRPLGEEPVATQGMERVSSSDSAVIHAASAPLPVGAYPHARRIGDLLLLSGLGPRRPGSNEIPGSEIDDQGRVLRYDIEAQTRAVFDNVRAVLEASGARLEDLVDVTVYLTNMQDDFAIYNRVWAEMFTDSALAPCRTTVGITALPTPIAIELKCTAWLRPTATAGAHSD